MPRPHILYITQYFGVPDKSRFTTRPWDFSLLMAKQGYKVTVLCSTAGVKDFASVKSTHPDITLTWIDVPYENDFSILKRLWSFLTFFVQAFIIQFSLSNVDLVYASSTPLSIGVLGRMIAGIRSIPWIFEIRDLWPDFPIQIGALKNKWIKGFLFALERHLYASASGVITLSPTATEMLLDKGVPTDKITTSFNGYSECIDEELRISIPKSAPFTMGYMGTLGQANAIPFLFEVVERVQHLYPETRFLIAGNGSFASYAKQRCSSLPNAHYLGQLSQIEALRALSSCHVSFIPFLSLPVLQANSPHKLFDSLRLGCIPVTTQSGWVARLLHDNSCGISSNRKDDQVRFIIDLMQDASKQQQMAQQAQSLSSQFKRELLFENVNKLLKKVLNLA